MRLFCIFDAAVREPESERECQSMKIRLPRNLGCSAMALGGDLKCQPVFAAGDQAEVLPEIGDLADPANQDALEDLLAVYRPEAIVGDLHPAYFTTSLGERVAQERGLRFIQVQHHRAHVAAVCLEYGFYEERVVGLAFDGTGYGDDKLIWGSEFFTGSLTRGFKRGGHFASVPLPGGDAAVREPWRIVAALLLERGVPEEGIRKWLALRNVPLTDLSLFAAGIKAKLAVGRSTSVGRWFDAVAALLGICLRCEFDAQAAIKLQQAAEQNVYEVDPADWPVEISGEQTLVIDFCELANLGLQEAAAAQCLAYAFHVAAARACAVVAGRLAERSGANLVVVSGGVFFNRLFDGLLRAEIEKIGLRYCKPEKLSPGDPAIALGQIGLALNVLNGKS